VKRTWETMEEAPADIEMAVRREVLPTIEEAGEAVAEAVPFLEEAGIIAGEVAGTAAVGVEALTNPLVAGGLLASALFETFYENGKRKRRRVTTQRAPDATRPTPPRRGPYLPGPRRAGPERRRFGPTDTPGSSMPPKNTTRGKKRKVGKAMKRKSATKRTVKKAKTSSKKKPKKKSTSYATTVKQEVHGQFKRESVSYFGFQATAGRGELFEVCADAIMRAMLKRHHLVIRRTDQAVPVASSVPQMQQLRLTYRRTKYDDGTAGNSFTGSYVNMSSGTYESHVATLAAEIKGKAEIGAYPYYFVSVNSSGNVVQQSHKIGDAKLNLSVKRVIKLRNITKNDDGGDTVNSLDTNPLQGRLYKFRHDVPRVNATLYETDVGNLSKFHDRVCTAGVIFGPQRNNSGDHDGAPMPIPGLFGQNAVLSSPPPGGRIWDNLSSSKKIGMAPGQAAVHKMAFKFSGTVRQFLSKFAASEYTPPSIGYCHMFGFEQKYKTGATDEVHVEYDCDDVLKGGCTFVREDLTPPTVRSIHGHSSIAP